MDILLGAVCHWLVGFSPCDTAPTNTDVLFRGFDAQVNGAMIAVPAFRRDFGQVTDLHRQFPD